MKFLQDEIRNMMKFLDKSIENGWQISETDATDATTTATASEEEVDEIAI